MYQEISNTPLVSNVRPLLVSAEEEKNILLELNKTYQSRLNSLNHRRRKLMFSANNPEIISEIVLLINDMELLRDNIESSRCHLSALLASAMSYIVSIVETTQNLQTQLMPRLRNDLRTITKIVQETKNFNVDYSALASLATRGALLMSIKDKEVTLEMTRRLFIVLKNTIV